MDLQGKVAVVTGGSGGIGQAMAKAFLANGASTVVLADLHADAVEAAAAGDYNSAGAEIVRIDAAVDKGSRLIYATAEVEDPYGSSASDGMPLAVGMFVSAEIMGVSERSAYVMPRLALRNQDKVYVINENNRLEIRTVNVISTSEERVLVSSGVSPGERVVTSTLPSAVDGMEVEPILSESRG